MHTVAEAIDRYQRTVFAQKRQTTQDAQKFHLDWWRERIGHFPINAIPRDVIAEARDHLLATETFLHTQRTGATVNRYLSALSHVIQTAIQDWAWCEENPVKRISRPRESKGRIRYLSADETRRLFAACDQSNNKILAALVELALNSGMRKGELESLEWETVEWGLHIENVACASFYIARSKNGHPRHVPVPVDHLPRLLAIRRDTGPLFPGDWSAAWNCARQRARLQDFRFHDLRHSHATHLARNSITLIAIANRLGHSTLDMVKRYSHLNPDDGAAAAIRAGAY